MKSPDIALLPYSWSSAWGEDKYGLWTEFRVHDAVQRMRWIRPGVFLMGSPLNEPERFDDESQHEVELTHRRTGGLREKGDVLQNISSVGFCVGFRISIDSGIGHKKRGK